MFEFHQKNYTINQYCYEKNQENLQLGTLIKNCKRKKLIFSKLSKVEIERFRNDGRFAT